VRGYGIKQVELAGTYNLSPEKFKEMLEANQLKPVSGHFPYDRYRDDPEGAARDAKTLGLQYAGCAWIPHEGVFDEMECRAAIAVFNKAGEVFAKQGIKFFYHVHGFEFQPHGQGTLLDLMMARRIRSCASTNGRVLDRLPGPGSREAAGGNTRAGGS
jgi:hypothetical protein